MWVGDTCEDGRWVTWPLWGAPTGNEPCPDCNADGAAPYEPTTDEMEEQGQRTLFGEAA